MIGWHLCPAHQSPRCSSEVVNGPIRRRLGLGILLAQLLEDCLVESQLEFRESADRCDTVGGEYEVAAVDLRRQDGERLVGERAEKVNLGLVALRRQRPV